MAQNGHKLSTTALAALVVGAMVGGGIFSLPQNMAQNAGAGAILLAWGITGIGIFFLTQNFRLLAQLQPESTTGIYTYSRLGFGRLAGFMMAWGYWLSNIFGNVGFAVLLMDALDYFFPGYFAGGNNLWSLLGGSMLLYLMNFLVLRGIHQAAAFNALGTIGKLLVIVLFIGVMIYVFSWSTFIEDFWGQGAGNPLTNHPLGTLSQQIKSTMLVTLWAFIGIEGAVVVSNQARSQKSVARATTIGFLGCLAIYILISLLPWGFQHQAQLATLSNPSTAGLMQMAVRSRWGGVVMNLGVIIALLTSWLSFTIMVAQIPLAAAQDGTFPRLFARTNRHGAPASALWITTLVMQLTLLGAGFLGDAWQTMLSITSVMILPPYLGCTLYLLKLSWKRQKFTTTGISRFQAASCAVVGTIYVLWMIYAAGLHYLMWAAGFALAGLPVFWWARYDARKANSNHNRVQ